MKTIPFNRVLFYLLLLGCALPLMIGYWFIQQKAAWQRVEQQIVSVTSLAEKYAHKQAWNQHLRSHYVEVDPLYLDHQLEGLCLLKKEKRALAALLENPHFTGEGGIEQRWAYLSSAAGKLEFKQAHVQNGEGFQETSYCLSHPVEIDGEDLKEILNRLEAPSLGKPLLLLTDFKISKKPIGKDNEVFELTMKLLKREFTP